MSDRVKVIVEKARRLQDFRYIFPELLEAIELLDEEVDALRARVAALEPVQPPAPAPLPGSPPLYIGSARALALADAVRAFLLAVGLLRRPAATMPGYPPPPINELRIALETFEKGKAT
jgi:hypothetical protein